MKFESHSYFEEKSHQVSGTITAFGIECCSRYGKAAEIKEMIDLCQELAAKNMSDVVQSLFYDSKSSCMTIKYIVDDIGHFYYSEVERIAEKHISQFLTEDGSVKHKGGETKTHLKIKQICPYKNYLLALADDGMTYIWEDGESNEWIEFIGNPPFVSE